MLARRRGRGALACMDQQLLPQIGENRLEHARIMACEPLFEREVRLCHHRVARSRQLRNRARSASSLTRSRSEEHTSELQSLMRISYAVFCLKKKNKYSLHVQA